MSLNIENAKRQAIKRHDVTKSRFTNKLTSRDGLTRSHVASTRTLLNDVKRRFYVKNRMTPRHDITMLLLVAFSHVVIGSVMIGNDETTGSHHVVHVESCMMETFNASCMEGGRAGGGGGGEGGGSPGRGPPQVLLIQSAHYGRMRVGRCVTSGFGYIGCQVDVRQYMDSKCSGRRECQLALPDPVMFKSKPCPADLTSYLEVTYVCVAVEVAPAEACHGKRERGGPGGGGKHTDGKGGAGRGREHGREGGEESMGLGEGERGNTEPTTVVALRGYFSSVIADETGYGTSHGCPWSIHVPRGQRINLTLFNFLDSWSSESLLPDRLGAGADVAGGEVAAAVDGVDGVVSYGSTRLDVCLEVAIVFDSSDRRPVSVCGGYPREYHVMTSRTNHLRIELSNRRMLRTMGTFIVKYTVVGCADVSPILEGWLRRTGDSLIVGCNYTADIWYLTCRDSRWIGDVGTCRKVNDNTPPGVMLMVIVGVVVGIVVGVMLLCVVTVCSKRCSYSSGGGPDRRINHETTNYHLAGGGPIGGAEHQSILIHRATSRAAFSGGRDTGVETIPGEGQETEQGGEHAINDWLLSSSQYLSGGGRKKGGGVDCVGDDCFSSTIYCRAGGIMSPRFGSIKSPCFFAGDTRSSDGGIQNSNPPAQSSFNSPAHSARVSLNQASDFSSLYAPAGSRTAQGQDPAQLVPPLCGLCPSSGAKTNCSEQMTSCCDVTQFYDVKQGSYDLPLSLTEGENGDGRQGSWEGEVGCRSCSAAAFKVGLTPTYGRRCVVTASGSEVIGL